MQFLNLTILLHSGLRHCVIIPLRTAEVFFLALFGYLLGQMLHSVFHIAFFDIAPKLILTRSDLVGPPSAEEGAVLHIATESRVVFLQLIEFPIGQLSLRVVLRHARGDAHANILTH